MKDQDANPPTVSDPDVWRSAAALVRIHGADASVHAAMRQDELAAAGDPYGAAAWSQIGKAVAFLQAERVPPQATAH